MNLLNDAWHHYTNSVLKISFCLLLFNTHTKKREFSEKHLWRKLYLAHLQMIWLASFQKCLLNAESNVEISIFEPAFAKKIQIEEKSLVHPMWIIISGSRKLTNEHSLSPNNNNLWVSEWMNEWTARVAANQYSSVLIQSFQPLATNHISQ